MVGGLAQPDIIFGVPAWKAGSAAKAAVTASKMSNIVRNRFVRKAADITSTGVGVSAFATGVEAVRQETSGVDFEDDLKNIAMFSMVLGSGVKATSDFLASTPNQSKIVKAMEEDIQNTNSIVYMQPGDAGPMKMKGTYKWSDTKVRPEDLEDMASTGVFGKLNVASPRGRLYNVQSQKLRDFLGWLAPSKLPLVHKDGSFLVQSKKSAEDVLNTTYKGAYNTLRNKMRLSFEDYKQKTDNPLNEYDYGHEVYKERIRVNKVYREHQAEVDYYKSTIDDLKKADEVDDVKITELENKLALTNDKIISIEIREDYKDAVKHLDEYYEFMNKQRNYWRGIDTDSVNPNAHLAYTSRLWNKDAIANMPKKDIVRAIVEARNASPTARMLEKIDIAEYNNFISKSEEIAENMADKISTAKSLNDLRDIMSKSGAGGNLTTGRFDIGRRIDVDEEMLGDLLHHNIDDIVELYHRDMSGKLSMIEATGMQTKEELFEGYVKPIVHELQDLGYTSTQIQKITDDLDVVIDTLLGQRSIAENPNSTGQTIKRYATGWNNVTLGMGFGWTAISEIGPALALTGVKGLKYLMPAIKHTIDKYRGIAGDKAIYNQLKAMGIGMDVYNSRVAARFSDDGINFAHTRPEQWLEKAQTKTMHASGLIGVTDAYKDMIGMAYIHNLHELGKRLNAGEDFNKILSKAERSRFARHGLTEQNIRDIGKQDVKYKDGLLEDLNWDNWDYHLKDKLSIATDRAVTGNILEPTALDLPKAMTDPNNVTIPLITQYLRFPIASTESYLLRGLAEADRAAAIGAMTSFGVMGTLHLGMDELLHSMGLIDEPIDLDDNEDLQKFAYRMFNYNPYTGMTPMLVNAGLATFGQPQPGSNYVPRDLGGVLGGVTMNRAQLAWDTLKSQVEDPGDIGKVEHRMFKFNTPWIGSVPGIREPWGEFIKEQ